MWRTNSFEFSELTFATFFGYLRDKKASHQSWAMFESLLMVFYQDLMLSLIANHLNNYWRWRARKDIMTKNCLQNIIKKYQ